MNFKDFLGVVLSNFPSAEVFVNFPVLTGLSSPTGSRKIHDIGDISRKLVLLFATVNDLFMTDARYSANYKGATI